MIKGDQEVLGQAGVTEAQRGVTRSEIAAMQGVKITRSGVTGA